MLVSIVLISIILFLFYFSSPKGVIWSLLRVLIKQHYPLLEFVLSRYEVSIFIYINIYLLIYLFIFLLFLTIVGLLVGRWVGAWMHGWFTCP